MIEREIKLWAPPQFSLPTFVDIEGISERDASVRTLRTVYYDADDFRLTRSGCSLRHRSDEGWTVKLPQQGEGELLARSEHVFAGRSDRPPVSALDVLAAYLRGSDVAPVARLRTKRQSVTLANGSGGAVALITDDVVSVFEERKLASRFREIEVELTENTPPGLVDRLIERLQTAGAGKPDPTSKIARALGVSRQAHPLCDDADLDQGSKAGDVVRVCLAQAVEQLVFHDARIRTGEDDEDVHKARVATRVLRSHLKSFMPLLDAAWSASLRSELGWLGQELGALRDAQVLLARLRRDAAALNDGGDDTTDPLWRFIEERDAARASLLQAMRLPRYIELLERLAEAARRPSFSASAESPALEVLPQLMARLWKKLCSTVDRAGQTPADNALHQIRIRTKRCRYAAEAAIPVVGKAAKAFAREAKRLQEVLGEHQDAVVAQAKLKPFSQEQARAFLAGRLSGLQSCAAERARESWLDAWRSVGKKRRREWF